tara:strand:- start:712 stop:978 length:267 start_codon:yes stop_codon:yes gene_type:complete
MEKVKQELPDWFNGHRYLEGDVVKNPFSGHSIELTAEELSMYDFIWGVTMIFSDSDTPDMPDKIYSDYRKGMDWFLKQNPEAYMVLLD